MRSNYIYMLKNTDAIGKHFKSKLIKSYLNHHEKVSVRGRRLGTEFGGGQKTNLI